MRAKNILSIRKKMGLTQEQLAHRVGVTKQTIYYWENGMYEPRGERLQKLCDALGVSESELNRVDYSHRKIPVLGHISAGNPNEAIEDILDYQEIPSDWQGEYFGLRVHGDSMYPKYQDGDTVIVRKQSDCDTGHDAVVLVGGFDATIKTIVKHDDGVELRPYNKKYKPMHFDSNIEILGVVVQLRRDIL